MLLLLLLGWSDRQAFPSYRVCLIGWFDGWMVGWRVEWFISWVCLMNDCLNGWSYLTDLFSLFVG